MYRKPMFRRVVIAVALLLAAGALFGIGIAVGIATVDGPCLGDSVPQKIIEDEDPSITAKIIEKMSKENIRNNLKFVYNRPIFCIFELCIEKL